MRGLAGCLVVLVLAYGTDALRCSKSQLCCASSKLRVFETAPCFIYAGLQRDGGRGPSVRATFEGRA